MFEIIEPAVKMQKKITPYVTFPIIDTCTLHCLYCGEGGELSISNVNMFNKNDIFEWYDEAIRIGVDKFRITGGEPLLHKDFREILFKLSEKAKTVLVNTNGTLLSKNVDKWINSPTNCKYVVNYHGSTEETFNKVTGTQGYFDVVREGIEMLAHENLLHRLNFAYCKANSHELFDVIAYCKYLGVDLKIQDIVSVPWQYQDWNSIFKDTKELEEEFEKKATFVRDHRYAKGFGTPCKVYTIDGVNITLKSVRNGSHYEMQSVCKECEYYPCHEGVYDLFVFPDNTAYACNWTDKSKAPFAEKREQLNWLVDVFQKSVYRKAADRILEMKTDT